MSTLHSLHRHSSRVRGCETCDGRGFTHFKKEGGYDDCVECQGMGLVILKASVQPESTYRKTVRKLSRILTANGR